MNQEQIKNKTYNWCKKLYKNGLFDVNNYNDCIASFNHEHQGEISNNLQQTRTGIENSFSLYNRTDKYITESNPENLDQKMYITSFNGRYLGCKSDGKFYLASDFQNSNINQSELEWTIISLENNYVSILNSNSQYLMTNLNNCVKAEGNSINAATKWELKRLDNNIYLVSSLFPEKKLTFTVNKEFVDLNVETGLNENAIWNLTPVNINSTGNIINEFDDTNLKAEKRNQLNNFIKGKKIQILINTEIYILRQLLHQIRTNINSIKTHIDNNFENSVSAYRSLSGKYIDELNSLDEYRRNLMTTNLNNTQYLMLTQNIQKLETKLKLTDKINMNRNMKTDLNRQLNNYMEQCTRDINNLITEREEYLKRQDFDNVDNKLESYMQRLEREVETLKNKNEQNNQILIKQSKMIDSNNQEIVVNEKQIKQYDSKDDAIKRNLNIMKYNIDNLKKSKIYKIIGIVIIIIIILFIIYKSYNNILIAYYS
jgi:hypothetical protein